MLKIGCAYAKSGDGGKYTVCNYGPGGNMAGANIYAEGEPASKCPEGYTPDDGLCGKGGNNGGDGGYEGSGNNSGGDGGNEGSGNNGAAGSSWDNSVPKYTTTNEMQEDPSGGGGGGGVCGDGRRSRAGAGAVGGGVLPRGPDRLGAGR